MSVLAPVFKVSVLQRDSKFFLFIMCGYDIICWSIRKVLPSNGPLLHTEYWWPLILPSFPPLKIFRLLLYIILSANVTCRVPRRKNGVTSVEGNMLPSHSVILSCKSGFLSNGTTIAACLVNGTLDKLLGNCVKGY